MATSTTLGYDDLPALLTELTGDEKHDHSALSTLDALWVLYDRILRLDASDPRDPERDRFLLSKGHGPAAYYAVLAAKGFIEVDALSGFGEFESALGYHPDHVLVPGVEISSGSLGHGLPIAVGTTFGLLARGRRRARVFCLVGDAEQRDKYNRLLAYVYRRSDGLFVNAELLRRGFAQLLTIPPNVAHTDEFVAIAARARADSQGLWAACPLQPDGKVGPASSSTRSGTG